MRKINGWYIPEKEDLEERARQCEMEDDITITVLSRFKYSIITLDIDKILSPKPEADKYILDTCAKQIPIIIKENE